MNNSAKIAIFIISLFVIIGIYIIGNSTIKSSYTPAYVLEDFYTIPDRKISINEYKNINISDDEMAKKYFNTFMNSVLESPEKTYNLIEDDYKEEYYPTYGKYLSYLKEITTDFTVLPLAERYKKDYDGKHPIYVVIDNYGNEYVFIVEAVMNYKVKFSL